MVCSLWSGGDKVGLLAAALQEVVDDGVIAGRRRRHAGLTRICTVPLGSPLSLLTTCARSAPSSRPSSHSPAHRVARRAARPSRPRSFVLHACARPEAACWSTQSPLCGAMSRARAGRRAGCRHRYVLSADSSRRSRCCDVRRFEPSEWRWTGGWGVRAVCEARGRSSRSGECSR